MSVWGCDYNKCCCCCCYNSARSVVTPYNSRKPSILLLPDSSPCQPPNHHNQSLTRFDFKNLLLDNPNQLLQGVSVDVAGLGGGGGEGQVGQPLVEQVEANPLTFLLCISVTLCKKVEKGKSWKVGSCEGGVKKK